MDITRDPDARYWEIRKIMKIHGFARKYDEM